MKGQVHVHVYSSDLFRFKLIVSTTFRLEIDVSCIMAQSRYVIFKQQRHRSACASVCSLISVFAIRCSDSITSLATILAIPRFCSRAGRFESYLVAHTGFLATWFTCEPHHDKTNKMTVRPAKTQISQGICPV